MKKYFLLFLLCIISAKASDKDDIINDAIKAIQSHQYISHSAIYRWIDESQGIVESKGKCYIKLVPEDTLVGAYYYLKSDEYAVGYNGGEYYYYHPEYYGTNTVDLRTRRKSPEVFSVQNFEMNGQKFFELPLPKNSQLFFASIPGIVDEINRIKDIKNYQFLSDTTINNFDCRRLLLTAFDTVISGEKNIETYTLAFDKKTKLPVYMFTYHPSQQQEMILSDFSFVIKDSNKLFSRKAFPRNYKFIEDAPFIKKDVSLKVGEKAPDWTLADLNGRKASLSDFKGSLVFLVFSEIGCVPCMLAIPDLNAMVKKYPNMHVLGIFPRDTREPLKKYVNKKGVLFDVFPNSKETGNNYHVDGYPTYFLIDENGILRYSGAGYGEDIMKHWEKEVNKLLKKEKTETDKLP